MINFIIETVAGIAYVFAKTIGCIIEWALLGIILLLAWIFCIGPLIGYLG